uniref:Protein kinase domain-containing protein n=1 Tax=Caenorhabditis tropicalis TaxID=1561998 RepID=A0A1I7TLX3_9PELO
MICSWGITCYEVFADGGEPFDGVSNAVVKSNVLSSKFLEMPSTTPEAIKKFLNTFIFVDASRRSQMGMAVAEFERMAVMCENGQLEMGGGAKQKLMKVFKKRSCRDKAINECEGEYADNKKLIETKDLRRQIPKGFSYFAVDFGLSNGYAHVIESHDHFPATFSTEIIAGMLDLPPKKWRKRETDEMTKQKTRAEKFKQLWEPFDWTKRLKTSAAGSSKE